MSTATAVWYVAYGSNIDSDRFSRYFDPDDRAVWGMDIRSLTVNRALYFAGYSSTWGGPVAFLSLVPVNVRTRCVARLLDVPAFEQIVRGENGEARGQSLIPQSLPKVGDWVPLPVMRSPTRGKYDALLRLPDIEGRPSLTVTTSREMDFGAPTKPYLSLIERAVGAPVDTTETRIGATNRLLLGPDERYQLKIREGRSSGFRLLEVPETVGHGPDFLEMGSVSIRGRRQRVWVRFGIAPADPRVGVSSDVAQALNLSGGPAEHLEIRLDRLQEYKQLSGWPGDIPESDVVYVAKSDGLRRSRWALLVNSRFASPVRVRGRSHVPPDHVRVAYALRTMASLDQGGTLMMQPLIPSLRDRSWLAWSAWIVKRPIHAILEWVVGAPPVALRSTEGLVGDDGRSIVRVDSTALDFLGCGSGDDVIVSWALRRARATVLLHTDQTRLRMREQLSESTGRQSRVGTGDIRTRLEIPTHLQAWLSSTLRSDLDIPSDSVVRVRRSVWVTIRKNSIPLLLPFAGLVVALVALPHVPLVVVVGVPAALFVAAIGTIRMRRPRVRARRPAKWRRRAV